MHQVGPGGRRRHFSRAFKRQIVEETLAGERSVSQIARDLDVNANLVFRWRRAYRDGQFDDHASLVPVNGIDDQATEAASTSVATEARPVESRSAHRPGHWDGQLSITTAGGHHVDVSGAVDPDVLQAALEVLR